MFHSAWRNYTNYGSDIGGYRSGNRTKDLFIRWAQLGAFCPLMENGGNGEHRPWMFDNTNQTLNIYRTFVDIHYELVGTLWLVQFDYLHTLSATIFLECRVNINGGTCSCYVPTSR